MNIIGGSFGTSGKAELSSRVIFIKGIKEEAIDLSEIANVNTSLNEQQKFGVLGFIGGGIFLAAVLAVFLSVIGVILGIVLAYFGSKYSVKSYTANISFKDGRTLLLSGSKDEVNSLVLI